MDSFEFTKIAGAVLSALLLIFGTKTAIEMTVGRTPEKPGFVLPVAAPARSCNGSGKCHARTLGRRRRRGCHRAAAEGEPRKRQSHIQAMPSVPRVRKR